MGVIFPGVRRSKKRQNAVAQYLNDGAAETVDHVDQRMNNRQDRVVCVVWISTRDHVRGVDKIREEDSLKLSLTRLVYCPPHMNSWGIP